MSDIQDQIQAALQFNGYGEIKVAETLDALVALFERSVVERERAAWKECMEWMIEAGWLTYADGVPDGIAEAARRYPLPEDR